jgi:hypothetical protein
MNASSPAIGFPDGGVENSDGGFPDIPPGAIALDEGDDGIVGNHQFPVDRSDLGALFRNAYSVVRHVFSFPLILASASVQDVLWCCEAS